MWLAGARRRYGSPYLMLKPPGGENYRYENLWTSGPGLHAADTNLARSLAIVQEDAILRGKSSNKGSGKTYTVLYPETVPTSIAI